MSALRFSATGCRSCFALARRVAVLIGLSALLVCADASGSPVSPLPASDYKVSPACGSPAPGHARCLALRLVPVSATARAGTHPLGILRGQQVTVASAKGGSDGFTPKDLQKAYFPGEAPEATAQTIALVDAYHDPAAASDLGVYDNEFGLPTLPPCTGAISHCFEQVNEHGETGNPPATHGPSELKEAEEWALETSTDIEMAHAICQDCAIVLVETDSASYADLEAGEEAAVALGATEISDSWGGEGPPVDSPAFNHPGIVLTAAAGDQGYLNWTQAKEAHESGEGYYSGADYPASSPHVVAVGGTKLTLTEAGAKSETVWNDGEANGAGGGGCSPYFAAAPWQSQVSDWSSVGCGSNRAVADVSADADPLTGVAVYDSVPYPLAEHPHATIVIGWTPIGGTSVASPIIASMFALAGGSNGVEYPAQTLYSHIASRLLYDVTEGGNGACGDDYSSCSGSLDPAESSLYPLDCGAGALICNASIGYDGPTGVGSPNSIAALKPLPQQVEPKKEPGQEKQPEAEKTKPASETGGSEIKTSTVETNRTETNQSSQSNSLSQTVTSSSSLSSEPKPRSSSAIRISALRLTPNAIFALDNGARDLPALSFAFTITRTAQVSVKLSRQVRLAGHLRWRALLRSELAHTAKGTNHSRLKTDLELTTGRYLLTLTAHGATRSIAFRVT